MEVSTSSTRIGHKYKKRGRRYDAGVAMDRSVCGSIVGISRGCDKRLGALRCLRQRLQGFCHWVWIGVRRGMLLRFCMTRQT
jgi:hypothetical protein